MNLKKLLESDTSDYLERALAMFPDDTNSLGSATDEIMDLSRMSREFLEEYDGVVVPPVDFTKLDTPSQWNTVGKKSIRSNFGKMSAGTRGYFMTEVREMFDGFV